MLRYDRQTKPGLVALYDIWPGKGAGPFLQPRSPHEACTEIYIFHYTYIFGVLAFRGVLRWSIFFAGGTAP